MNGLLGQTPSLPRQAEDSGRDYQSPQPRAVMSGAGQGMRQSGKQVIRERIQRLRNAASNMEIVLNMLPEQPTDEQDEALWQLANSIV